MQKDLAVIHQQFVELFQLLLPSQEPPARSGHIAVENIVHDCRGQIARCQKLLGTHIPFLKPKLHGKAEDIRNKDRFIIFILEGESVRQLCLLLGRNIRSLHQKVIQFLYRHGAVRHHGQDLLLNSPGQFSLIIVILIKGGDLRAQLRQTIHPPAHKAIVKLHTGIRVVPHIPKQSFDQVQLIRTNILADIPAQNRHNRRKIKAFHFLTSFCSIFAQFAFNVFSFTISYNELTKVDGMNPIISAFAKKVNIDNSTFRVHVQGGDRYPEDGSDQSDRVLPQNRRRQGRIGKANIRRPRRSSKPAAEVAELPHKSKTGPSGSGHRNRKAKKQGTDLTGSLFPAFSMLFP